MYQYQIERLQPIANCGSITLYEINRKLRIKNNPTKSKFKVHWFAHLVHTALFHSLTSDLDEILVAVAGIQLHIVFGDISNETTDVIVNTTDFRDLQTGWNYSIMTIT